jgi:hypothetical protein
VESRSERKGPGKRLEVEGLAQKKWGLRWRKEMRLRRNQGTSRCRSSRRAFERRRQTIPTRLVCGPKQQNQAFVPPILGTLFDLTLSPTPPHERP